MKKIVMTLSILFIFGGVTQLSSNTVFANEQSEAIVPNNTRRETVTVTNVWFPVDPPRTRHFNDGRYAGTLTVTSVNRTQVVYTGTVRYFGDNTPGPVKVD